MTTRLLQIGIIIAAAACATPAGRTPTVQVRVVNGARYTMAIRTCAPSGCSPFRTVRPGGNTTFIFPWRRLPRHVVEGKDGNRVAIQTSVDFDRPGRQNVTLVPPYHPQESTK